MTDDTKILQGVWYGMIHRCHHKNATNYLFYGGRGISVCDEWRSSRAQFVNWALENGYKKGLRLDRVDNNGDYSPENCRFITHKENCQNRRNTSHFGKFRSLALVRDRLGVFQDRKSYDRLRHFIKRYGSLSENLM